MTDPSPEQTPDEAQPEPTTTLVPGPLRRSVNYDSFAHLTDAVVLLIDNRGVEFDAILDAETIAAIAAFISSTSDEDQAARALVRAAAADGALNLAKMLTAYTLGDPIPPARYACTRECGAPVEPA